MLAQTPYFPIAKLLNMHHTHDLIAKIIHKILFEEIIGNGAETLEKRTLFVGQTRFEVFCHVVCDCSKAVEQFVQNALLVFEMIIN